MANTSNKIPISIFVITKNEERCLSQVLQSAKELSNDLVVVDSGSTDQTESIARNHNARFIFNKWQGYGEQKRFAEDCCAHDWVLNLDADEVLSNDLIKEVKEAWVLGFDDMVGYELKVTTVYPHHDSPRFFAEYNPVVRLYNKKNMRFRNHPTLDTVVLPSDAGRYRFKAPCLHYSMKDLSHYIEKMNRYTDYQSEALGRKNHVSFWAMMILGFPFEFLRAYIGKRHITGGWYGFILSMTRAYFRVVKYAKQKEKLPRNG
jgi:glycosyltransferase involved in cell wall biosynthesis